MAIGKLEYEITLDSSQVERKLKKLTTAINVANSSLQLAQCIVNTISQMQVTLTVGEKKNKKWYQFWK